MRKIRVEQRLAGQTAFEAQFTGGHFEVEMNGFGASFVDGFRFVSAGGGGGKGTGPVARAIGMMMPEKKGER